MGSKPRTHPRSHTYRFGFIIEQTLGHITHGRNLQALVSEDSSVRASWGLPSWEDRGIENWLPVVRSNWTLRAGLQTRRILKGMNHLAKPQALFFHSQVAAVLSPDWLRRIPSVVSLDATPKQYDSLGEYYSHAQGSAWLEHWKWRLNRDCFRLARRLVTWSEWAQAGLVDEYEVPPGKIAVIPPGVDVQAWTPPDAERRSDGPVKILFVGGDFQRKGGLVLLEAFRILRSRFSSSESRPTGISIELHLVTRDPVPEEPGVFVYNQIQPNSAELKHLYFASNIFCLPTSGDCLPMALSEAGAAGLPLVSTPVAAIPEIVQEGKTGALTPIGDALALAAALQRLVEDPDLRLHQGRAANRLVSECYDARKNTARLLAVLKEVAVDRSTGRGAG